MTYGMKEAVHKHYETNIKTRLTQNKIFVDKKKIFLDFLAIDKIITSVNILNLI